MTPYHDDTTVTDQTAHRNADVAPRRRGLRDTRMIASIAGAALALGAGLAVAAAGSGACPGSACPSQPPDPATVIPAAAAQGAQEHSRRDQLRWPLNPTARDLRVRGVNIRKFLALGRCEAGPGSGHGGIRFRTPSGWRWQGAYGLYVRTHQSVGHPYGADAGQMTWQEQTLVAQRVMERYGIGAWGAASCYLAA